MRPHVMDNYAAGRHEPVVFPWIVVDNMKVPRSTIIGFKYPMRYRVEGRTNE